MRDECCYRFKRYVGGTFDGNAGDAARMRCCASGDIFRAIASTSHHQGLIGQPLRHQATLTLP